MKKTRITIIHNESLFYIMWIGGILGTFIPLWQYDPYLLLILWGFHTYMVIFRFICFRITHNEFTEIWNVEMNHWEIKK